MRTHLENSGCVLDVGCGFASVLEDFDQPDLKIGLDINKKNLKILSKKASRLSSIPISLSAYSPRLRDRLTLKRKV